jgi:hypothetical protein
MKKFFKHWLKPSKFNFTRKNYGKRLPRNFGQNIRNKIKAKYFKSAFHWFRNKVVPQPLYIELRKIKKPWTRYNTYRAKQKKSGKRTKNWSKNRLIRKISLQIRKRKANWFFIWGWNRRKLQNLDLQQLKLNKNIKFLLKFALKKRCKPKNSSKVNSLALTQSHRAILNLLTSGLVFKTHVQNSFRSLRANIEKLKAVSKYNLFELNILNNLPNKLVVNPNQFFIDSANFSHIVLNLHKHRSNYKNLVFNNKEKLNICLGLLSRFKHLSSKYYANLLKNKNKINTLHWKSQAAFLKSLHKFQTNLVQRKLFLRAFIKNLKKNKFKINRTLGLAVLKNYKNFLITASQIKKFNHKNKFQKLILKDFDFYLLRYFFNILIYIFKQSALLLKKKKLFLNLHISDRLLFKRSTTQPWILIIGGFSSNNKKILVNLLDYEQIIFKNIKYTLPFNNAYKINIFSVKPPYLLRKKNKYFSLRYINLKRFWNKKINIFNLQKNSVFFYLALNRQQKFFKNFNNFFCRYNYYLKHLFKPQKSLGLNYEPGLKIPNIRSFISFVTKARYKIFNTNKKNNRIHLAQLRQKLKSRKIRSLKLKIKRKFFKKPFKNRKSIDAQFQKILKKVLAKKKVIKVNRKKKHINILLRRDYLKYTLLKKLRLNARIRQALKIIKNIKLKKPKKKIQIKSNLKIRKSIKIIKVRKGPIVGKKFYMHRLPPDEFRFIKNAQFRLRLNYRTFKHVLELKKKGLKIRPYLVSLIKARYHPYNRAKRSLVKKYKRAKFKLAWKKLFIFQRKKVPFIVANKKFTNLDEFKGSLKEAKRFINIFPILKSLAKKKHSPFFAPARKIKRALLKKLKPVKKTRFVPVPKIKKLKFRLLQRRKFCNLTLKNLQTQTFKSFVKLHKYLRLLAKKDFDVQKNSAKIKTQVHLPLIKPFSEIEKFSTLPLRRLGYSSKIEWPHTKKKTLSVFQKNLKQFLKELRFKNKLYGPHAGYKKYLESNKNKIKIIKQVFNLIKNNKSNIKWYNKYSKELKLFKRYSKHLKYLKLVNYNNLYRRLTHKSIYNLKFFNSSSKVTKVKRLKNFNTLFKKYKKYSYIHRLRDINIRKLCQFTNFNIKNISYLYLINKHSSAHFNLFHINAYNKVKFSQAKFIKFYVLLHLKLLLLSESTKVFKNTAKKKKLANTAQATERIKINEIIKKIKKKKLKLVIKNRIGWFEASSFYKKKWFRKRFKRWVRNYRRIYKNINFITLFRKNFQYFTNFNEKQLMNFWFQFRFGTNIFWGFANLVQKFNQSLLLLPQNFIIFLGLAPSQFASKILIQSGCIIINGVSSVKFSTFIKPGDIVQVLPQMINYSKIMFKYQQWSYVKTRLNYISFLQVDWALLMFSIIKWPLKYELIGPSFLSERWVRFYIRYFPKKKRKLYKIN